MNLPNSSEQKSAGRNGLDNSALSQTGASELVSDPTRGLSKSNEAFWKPRLRKRAFRTRKGAVRELPDWQVQLHHDGRQRWVKLGTPNRDSAAKKARDAWLKLQAKGWAAVIEDKRGKIVAPTVGEYLATVRALGGISETAFEIYAAKFRRLVVGMCGIRGTKERYAYQRGGHLKWRERVEAVKLRRLTPALVKRWQTKYLKKMGKNPLSQQKAKTTINSLLRSASALFSAKVRKNLTPMDLPDPLPFAEIERPVVRVARYVSKIEPALLFQQAQRELAEPDAALLRSEIRQQLEEAEEGAETRRRAKGAEKGRNAGKRRAVTDKWIEGMEEKERARRREMFLVFCLALFAGLRRDEIDTLTWKQIDFERGTIHVETTAHGKVKSFESDRVVDVGAGLVEILRRAMQASSSEFVVAGATGPRMEASSYHHYRKDRLMDRLVKWLKAHGVESTNALHTLRKEFGTQINLEHGIFAASAALGHSSIQLTRSVYVAKKARAVFDVPASGLAVVPDAGKEAVR